MLAPVLLLSTVLSVAPSTLQFVDVDPDAARLQLPAVMTPSGDAFVARCDDAAFAASRRPAVLAERCERLLALWRLEVRIRVDGFGPPEMVRFGAPRGIPAYPTNLPVAYRR